MVRVLMPWYLNIGKRIVRNPKIYLRDSGIFHSLISVEDNQQLLSHNKLGASWEGFALEMIINHLDISDEKIYFWATHSGAELDMFWQQKGKNWGIEIKYNDAPKISKSMKISIKDLKLDHLWVIYPGKESYQLDKNITVLPITDMNKIVLSK